MHITSYVPNIEKKYIKKHNPILNTINSENCCNDRI